MPMRRVVVAMRTSIRNPSNAAASVNMDMMNRQAMKADKRDEQRGQRNEGDRGIDPARAARQDFQLGMQVRAVLHIIRPEQSVLHGPGSIDDACQAARENIERHPDRRNEKYRRQRDLDQMRDINRLGGKGRGADGITT
jgi:hypothetical protein